MNNIKGAECQPKRVAVTQMTSTQDKEVNFKTCVDLVERAAESGAQMVFLPEACDYIVASMKESIQKAESIHGPLVSKYQNLAASVGVWLSLGGLHLKEEGENKISNTHIVINDKGEIVSTYTKVHLFNVDIPESNLHLHESAVASAGQAIHSPVSTPVGEVALAICYDVRFPEMSLIQRRCGAEILTYPSAFTVATGVAHWETLLRVRAIETQCYVIAAAQTGEHNSKRSSFGHAMIVDPWGTVMKEINEGVGFACADIDINYLKKIREKMPVQSHRRVDLYHINEVLSPEYPRICDLRPFPSPYISYQFGEVFLPGSCVFLKSQLSHAFVNKKPLVPGHILLAPERPAKRFINLTAAEISDLAQLTQKALKVVMSHYEPKRCQVAIQDGPAAGQSIDHVHIHVVPESTDIMQKLQGHEEKHVQQWKEREEMEEEANKLRQVVTQIFPNLSDAASGIPRPLEITKPEFDETFLFGPTKVPQDFFIVKTKHSCAFMAPNPVLPGHVYVTLIKPCESFLKASPEQVTDLFLTMLLVQQKLESSKKVTSSTFVIVEDSKLTKNQLLQVHIIPRIKGDLTNNDDIYAAVLRHYSWHSMWTFSMEIMDEAHRIRTAIYDS